MNREQRVEKQRQEGNDLWLKKFDEYDLSERFELIARDWSYDRGRRADVKCITCGAIFKSTIVYEIFRGKIKHLTCPECGTKSDGSIQWTKAAIHDEAIAYYLQGHTRGEVAEKFNISVSPLKS